MLNRSDFEEMQSLQVGLSAYGIGSRRKKKKNSTKDLIEKKNKLKLYIYENDKIVDIMEYIGCTDIKPKKDYIRSNPPTLANTNSLQSFTVAIRPTLIFKMFSDESIKGDIIELVAMDRYTERTNENIRKAISDIEKLLGITQDDYINLEIEEIEEKTKEIDVKDMVNEIIDKPTSYVHGIHEPWCDEGILPEVQESHEVGLHYETNRVVFPIKNQYGNYVGLKGRYLGSETDVPKYSFIQRCQIGYELFGLSLYKAQNKICNTVFIFEGEKSVMKMNSIGILSAFSVGGSTISKRQAYILNSQFKNCKIVMLFDTDKDEEAVREACKHLEHEEIYTYKDVNNLLDYKDAPIDKGFNILKELLSTAYKL